MDLAVVTSAWGDYGRYLPEWAESITAQTIRPAQAVIFDVGCRDTRPVSQAVEILMVSGIDAHAVRGRYRGMGAARNDAVAATAHEWVMHLDADDTLLPHAVADIAGLTHTADVVSLGAIRGGREICFPHVSREMILARGHGVFSCSPFRRSLWQQRPFHTRNDWIDSVFWVGLAHLGARFVGTTRPGFVYRQHQGSFSRRLTRLERRSADQQWRDACRHWSLT